MANNPNILEDLSRLATDALGAAQGVRKDIETMVRAQVEKIVKDLDIASREEAEVAKELAAKAVEENKALAARLLELEQRVEKLETK
ncbi:MAG: accessory factor UbiK family protein [Methylobacteriaceae bacterium]|nr:accessory factor UbiK family protein [Methylobacteriaceae bacterium]